MSLLLFCLTWISALCVVTRPFRTTLPYDELIFSLSYAIFSASAGLHTLVFYLLTRNDISAVCCSRKRPPQKIEVLPPEMLRPPVPPPSVDEPVKNERNKEIETIQRVDMNVTLDPATLLNSFYDARQSKTARRFFQKQKLLQSQNNNQQQVTQQQYPTEEALLNLSSSSKAKVNNVNIHVELGAYDWHELQTRMSDHSWTKSGKVQLLFNYDSITFIYYSITQLASKLSVGILVIICHFIGVIIRYSLLFFKISLGFV